MAELENKAATAAFTDDYLLFLLAQASAAASNEFHATLQKDGLSTSLWRILASLYPAENLKVGQLAAKCLLKQPTLTRALDRLEKDGLVKRHYTKSDRRAVIIALTEQGFALTGRIVRTAKTHEQQVLASYSEAQAASLKQTLNDLIRHLRP